MKRSELPLHSDRLTHSAIKELYGTGSSEDRGKDHGRLLYFKTGSSAILDWITGKFVDGLLE